MTTTMGSTIRGGIYCRIADDPTGEGLGVERQRKECAKVAERLGWTVTDTYIDNDNDISASGGEWRPEYERLLADISLGEITGFLAWHPDRINRSPLEWERPICSLV